MPSPSSTLVVHWVRGLLVLAVTILLGGCSGPSSDESSLTAQLSRARLPRSIQPRLSFDVTHRPCRPSALAADAVPSAVCAAKLIDADALVRVRAVRDAAQRRLHVRADADALHAQALVELVMGPATARAISGLIDQLEQVQRLEPSADVYADLAAAYLVRAGAEDRPSDLVAALDAAHHSLSLDSTHAAARFNAILAEERLRLDHVAAKDRDAYLAIDSGSSWAGEVWDRTAPVNRSVVTPIDVLHADSAALIRLSALDPQTARQIVLDSLMPAWGTAVLAGDSVMAKMWLHRAGILGGGLLLRPGGDHTASNLVASARALQTGTGREALAFAHVRYGAGQAAFAGRRFSEAAPLFEESERDAGASPTLRHWARYYRLVMGHYAAGEDASARFADLLTLSDTLRYPVLNGRILHSLTTLAGRRGSFAQALDHARAAERSLLRAGERQNAAAVQMLASEDAYHLGDVDESVRWMRLALRVLREGGTEQWLHNQLYVAAQGARSGGLAYAETQLLDEDVASVASAGPYLRVEARLLRAAARARLGRTVDAQEDIAAGTALLDSLPEPRNREWSRQDLRLASVMLERSPTPAGLARIDSVVVFFNHPDGVTRLVDALGVRANLRRTAGDVVGAESDLDSLSRMLQRRVGLVQSPSLRASVLETGRGVTDGLAMLHIHAGRPREALEAVERGRSPQLERAQAAGAVGVHRAVAASLALVGDTLLAWTVLNEGVRFRMDTVPREELLRTIEQVSAGLQGGVESNFSREALASLEALILPLLEPLPPDAELVIVADGELARIPFAALRGRKGKYLLEDRVVRMAASLSEAVPQRSYRAAVARGVFVSADFDRKRHPGLDPLPEAVTEVREAAALYPRHLLLAGAEATPSRVRAAFAGGGVFHVAGHAVFDDLRPWRSFLVLAPEAGGDVMFAEDIEGMDLRGVRLLVLSACQTQRAAAGRATGMAGLTGAAMRAGADGVIGSIWRVDDRQTRMLMTALHRAYPSAEGAAVALRQAQLSFLHSTDPTLRSPAAWAGFRYAGR